MRPPLRAARAPSALPRASVSTRPIANSDFKSGLIFEISCLYIRPLLFDTFIIYRLSSLLGSLVIGMKPARYPYQPIQPQLGLSLQTRKAVKNLHSLLIHSCTILKSRLSGLFHKD